MSVFGDVQSLVNVLIRWSHIVFGIIWLGHLYFFNLVNVPFQGGLDKELKPKVNPALLLRAFWWFRWGAMYTFIFGLLMFGYKYFHQHLFFEQGGGISNRALWIMFGGLLGTIMWFNVWFVIWPRQKKILGGLAAGTPHPDAAKLAATAVVPARRGGGVGGAMMNELFRLAAGRFDGVILSVRASNPALRFYERLGFQRERALTNRVGGVSFVMRRSFDGRAP